MSEQLARQFHEIYERLAPSFGYETRTETRAFEPTTPNGRLMIAVTDEIEAAIQQRIAELTAELARRDEIISRLKEDGERLAENWMDRQSSSCDYCGRWYRFDYHEATYSCDHADNCPITLHRALMKEVK